MEVLQYSIDSKFNKSLEMAIALKCCLALTQGLNNCGSDNLIEGLPHIDSRSEYPWEWQGR